MISIHRIIILEKTGSGKDLRKGTKEKDKLRRMLPAWCLLLRILKVYRSSSDSGYTLYTSKRHHTPALISSPSPRSRDLSSHHWSKSQSKLTRLQTPPRSDLKYTKCMKRYQMFENKIFRNTKMNNAEQTQT